VHVLEQLGNHKPGNHKPSNQTMVVCQNLEDVTAHVGCSRKTWTNRTGNETRLVPCSPLMSVHVSCSPELGLGRSWSVCVHTQKQLLETT
jgi:hypothetical protein